MKKYLVALIVVLGMNALVCSVKASDYCNGEWPEEADKYCNGLKMYANSIYIDAKMGRSKPELMSEIPNAVKNHLIPAELAHNYIEYIFWGIKETDREQSNLVVGLEGGCIDKWEYLASEGLKQALEQPAIPYHPTVLVGNPPN